nr:hypothetical protein [bacterium]
VCVSVLLYIALGAYRLRIAAWWTAAAGILLWCISLVTTVSRRGMMAYYEHMNMPAQQLEQIKPIASHMTPWMNTLMILWMVVIVGYLIMIRKYFTGSEILTQRFQVPEAE